VWLRSDFWADGLWLWECQSFGARSAPLSPVGIPSPMLPASAPPHFPNTSGTGHERGLVVLDQGRRPETPNRDPAAPAQCHKRTDEAAARAVFSYIAHSHGNIGTASWNGWGSRAGCRPCLQLGKDTARSHSSRNVRFCILPTEPGVQLIAAPWLSLFLTRLYSLLRSHLVSVDILGLMFLDLTVPT
jgi:hypothetical protein